MEAEEEHEKAENEEGRMKSKEKMMVGTRKEGKF